MPVVIDVVIVEAHHHCLEHYHAVIRKKKIFRPWSMLHFDAHPDLACPANVPAVACFTPRRDEEKDLYELLDSTASGIAEWILPLVLAAQLHTIEWVKPSFSTQLPTGYHRFQIGVYDPDYSNKKKLTHFLELSPQARLKVDYNHPYYLDDDSVVPSQDMALAQTLNLHVSNLELQESNPLASFQRQQSSVISSPPQQLWSLDICLDYFACWNPYLSDIDQIDPELTTTFLAVMNASQCFSTTTLPSSNNSNAFTVQQAAQYQENVQDFRNALQQVLLLATTSDDNNSIDAGQEWWQIAPQHLESLSRYYSSKEFCQTLIHSLVTRIRQHHHPAESSIALKAILDAIPFWNMPHAPSTDCGWKDSIQRAERALRSKLFEQQTASPPPFLITVARSTCDGFTPAPVVEAIQEEVLAMLHRVFDGSSNKNKHREDWSLRVTKDYGEWEGATIPL